MKALTLTQPWATLVAIGAKQIETRSWATHYRGAVAIHAAKKFPPDCRALVNRSPFQEALSSSIPENWMNAVPMGFPLGFVVAIAQLTHCWRFEGYAPASSVRHSNTPYELAFGDFTAGRYGFVLRDVQILPEPIPARGALGLWEWQEPW